MRRCYESGINFFDTAESYGNGAAEKQLGVAIKALNVDRKNIVVSTKIYKISNSPNDWGMSRKHIIEGTKYCLKRLQLDYVDIIYAHKIDYDVPLEE